MYIGDPLARRAVYTPDQRAFVDADSGIDLTYAQFNARANRMANFLAAQGVGKGDRVGVLMHNRVEVFDLLFACGKLGAVMVPFNWRLAAREVETLLRRVSPEVLLHGWDAPIGAIMEALHTLSGMPPMWALGEGKGPSQPLQPALDAASAAPVTCEGLREGDTACLLFTGGTTGLPKAAKISHRQIVWNAFNTHLGDAHGTDTYLNVFPLFHTGGLFAYSVPMLILGGTVIQTRRVDAQQILRLIEAEGVTIFAAVPTVFQMMADAPNWDEADLSSLRYCLSGGAPMPVPLIRTYRDEKGVTFRQGFGMTEFGPSVFSLPAADAIRKAGSIGRPNFFVDARVVNPETNAPLPAHTVGELVLRGPTATTGYFKDEAATQNAFDEEGYFHTGDLARVDEEGYFFIVDRLKNMFISGGENVYPAEVEQALYEHPAVGMCCVVAVPDADWGEVGWAFVVPKGDPPRAEDLIAFLRERIAKYKVPKAVHIVDELPISGAGKIQRTTLEARARAMLHDT
jgi:fatty-acyl-CoA synthase